MAVTSGSRLWRERADRFLSERCTDGLGRDEVCKVPPQRCFWGAEQHQGPRQPHAVRQGDESPWCKAMWQLPSEPSALIGKCWEIRDAPNEKENLVYGF